MDTFTVTSAPADTVEPLAGSVSMTFSGATFELVFFWTLVLNPRFCSAATASDCDLPVTSGTWTSRDGPLPKMMAKVTMMVSTTSAARPTSQRLSGLRRGSSYWLGSGPVCGPEAGKARVFAGVLSIVLRSASVSTLGASGCSPWYTRIRSARISAAFW
ncbi:Uncharacterised protein [Mycobacteroides abscessus subsp. abscessus]|nr:Uncharacterised protein [Mycobacteroides abscessus subsp. abscessus]